MTNLKNIKVTNFEKTIKEKNFNFDFELYENCPDNVQINGFFQSEKYFKKFKKEILEDFSFKKNTMTR